MNTSVASNNSTSRRNISLFSLIVLLLLVVMIIVGAGVSAQTREQHATNLAELSAIVINNAETNSS